MATVLFVHGTGVRQDSNFTTLLAIRRAFERYGIAQALEPCLWGDSLGATPVLRSVPDVTLSPRDQRTLQKDQDYARWELLYRDCLFELRLLKSRPSPGPKPPTVSATVKALWKRISCYSPSDRVRALIDASGLDACWSAAWKTVVTDDGTARQATESASEVGEPAQAVARAVVAETLRMAFDLQMPILASQQRDELVDLLVDDWDGRVAGVGTFLLNFFGEMAAKIATPIIRKRRGSMSEASSQAVGDILRYQARGEPIREYIRTIVGNISGDVYLLAHSLGGIACVDLLVQKPLAKVKGLITVGTQASYFHEIGALSSLEPSAKELPLHFPPWLNLYDPYDFLSYVAEPIFKRGVRDVRIESGQPFPHSHSAYWTNPSTWDAIGKFIV